ncbi:hypothetical protein ER308_10390 [Egibacter rhizosphaerae]|uniref:Alcohol dehydrogenase-like C-terminal domain-containing protein n=1 Tax=Egibacter rhizosphaerae TaxID=1670831 RepID=A0A411YFC4_9ACTN|nr:hypothetical protein [Egibacter rhizosphaerae]QBI19928.1 hypothetical protein ER308_10390 [Egibacter rhizosphaerae]
MHALAGTPGGAPVDANLVHYRHLTLVGSTGSALKHYLPGLELVARGLVPLERLPVEQVGLDEVPDRLANGPAGSALKTIVRPG